MMLPMMLLAVDTVVDVTAQSRTTLILMVSVPAVVSMVSLVVKHLVDKRNAAKIAQAQAAANAALTDAQTAKLLSASATAAAVLRESQLVQHNDFLQAQLKQVKDLYDAQLKQTKEMYENEKVFREEMKKQLELKLDVQEKRITGLVEELKRLKSENEVLRTANDLRGPSSTRPQQTERQQQP